MKYTCDITLTDSKESNPSESVEYQYFVRAKDADDCLCLILADLQACELNRTRILDIWLEEAHTPDVSFPDGDGIVYRRGPIEMTKVQCVGLRQRIKKLIMGQQEV